jgi:hypothetical protein
MTLLYMNIRLIYVNITLFTRFTSACFRLQGGHPQGQLIYSVSWVSKIAYRCKYQIKEQGVVRYVTVVAVSILLCKMAVLRWKCACHWMTTLRPRESRELLTVNHPWPRTHAPIHFCKQLLLRNLTLMRFARHNFGHFNHIQFRDKTRFLRSIICFYRKYSPCCLLAVPPVLGYRPSNLTEYMNRTFCSKPTWVLCYTNSLAYNKTLKCHLPLFTDSTYFKPNRH